MWQIQVLPVELVDVESADTEGQLYLNSSGYIFLDYNLRLSSPPDSITICNTDTENIRLRTVLGALESNFHGDADFALFTDTEPAKRTVVGSQWEQSQ